MDGKKDNKSRMIMKSNTFAFLFIFLNNVDGEEDNKRMLIMTSNNFTFLFIYVNRFINVCLYDSE